MDNLEYPSKYFIGNTEKYEEVSLSKMSLIKMNENMLLRYNDTKASNYLNSYFLGCFDENTTISPIALVDREVIETSEDFEELCPWIYHMVSTFGIHIPSHAPKTKAMLIGYAFVFFIHLTAAGGLLFMPCLKLKAFRNLLSFMVGMGMSILAGNAFLNMLPDSFGIVRREDDLETIFICLTICITVLFCFIIQRILRFLIVRDEKLVKRQTDRLMEKIYGRIKVDKNVVRRIHADSSGWMNAMDDLCDEEEKKQNNSTKKSGEIDERKKCCSFMRNERKIKPGAWILIFGDALSIFVDGIVIGASINKSIAKGLTIAIVVISEEFPHRLGDFAVLLKCHMTPIQAIIYSYVSASTIFIGYTIGFIIGSQDDVARWIFALATGNYLFISYGIMLQEMNEEMKRRSISGILRLTLLHTLGMIFGLTSVVLLLIYGERIKL
ncbi:hypothetical protein SNEBB_008696 [Seison nebaliae]|nr:hypothetical protein SNEBB_008696 [Seison nebaliae]